MLATEFKSEYLHLRDKFRAATVKADGTQENVSSKKTDKLESVIFGP